MATKIRLRRMGSRNKPFYRLVAADSRFATTGRFLEILGWYDPKQSGENFSVNIERVDYWLNTGAKLSPTAKSLVKKARDGQGVPAGSAPEKKAVETTVAEESPAVEEPKAEETAPAETAPVEEAAPAEETAPVEEAAPAEAEASEKQEA